jgi:hypothetical protein
MLIPPRNFLGFAQSAKLSQKVPDSPGGGNLSCERGQPHNGGTKPDHSLIVLDFSSTWCQIHHLLTIKFEYRLMSAVPESGATHIASVAESALSAFRRHPQALIAPQRSTKKYRLRPRNGNGHQK